MKANKVRWILSILTVITLGQVIWWAYLLNYHHALLLKYSPVVDGMQSYQSFQRMIVLESVFFFIIWSVFMYFAYRSHKKESELQRAHSTFLGAISHELKTPLAVIRLSLDTLSRPTIDEKKKEIYIERANQATDKLIKEVEAILQLTNISHLNSSKQRFSLNQMVNDCIEQIKIVKPHQNLNLDINFKNEFIVRGAPLESRLVLLNIIENAIKYGSGKVHISAEDVGKKTSLVVKDDGIGMTKEEIKNAFEPFWRSERVVKDAKPGTGVGLSLARELSKKAGIQILLDSDGIDQGTTTRIYWENAIT